MRLICADALLEEVNKIAANHMILSYVKGKITNAPTVQREGWVSVEDRLPDCDEFLGADFRGNQWIAVCWKFKVHNPTGEFYKYTGGNVIHKNNITHWQPLPAAPTDKE